MAFVVEDGTGLSNSNGYISDTFFTEYHTDRGRDLNDPDTAAAWTVAQINAATVVASDFIDSKFFFVGLRLLATQSMEWPRTNAFYNDGRIASGVPVEIEECVAELALKQLSGEIAPDPEYSDTNTPVTQLRQKVGPIEEETHFGDGGNPISFRAYPFAEEKMKELVLNGNFVERV